MPQNWYRNRFQVENCRLTDQKRVFDWIEAFSRTSLTNCHRQFETIYPTSNISIVAALGYRVCMTMKFSVWKIHRNNHHRRQQTPSAPVDLKGLKNKSEWNYSFVSRPTQQSLNYTKPHHWRQSVVKCVLYEWDHWQLPFASLCISIEFMNDPQSVQLS